MDGTLMDSQPFWDRPSSTCQALGGNRPRPEGSLRMTGASIVRPELIAATGHEFLGRSGYTGGLW